jgi:hypothetical protein
MARERDLPESLLLKSAAVQLPVFLMGINYPARKEQLIVHAKSKSAPENVLKLLNRLPERDYARSGDVTGEANKIV